MYAMGYGLVHTAAILVVLVLFFPQLDPAGDEPGHGGRVRALGSFSFVGIGMMAAILPLLYVERGAQMTFVLQSCLLLVSGVYYPVAILPPWMQALSHLSPATYVLDGVRAGLLDGTPVTALTYDVVPLIVMGIVLIPTGVWAFGARRALREAHRQAQEGRLMAAIGRTLADLGWDPGWAATFTPFAASGWLPARVMAAHRDAWTLGTPAGERDAVIAGRLRHAALRPADLPAVGDWVAAGGGSNDHGPVVIHAILPRRTVFQRGADGGHAVDEQVLAANVDVALVVAGLDGDFNLRRLERYLAVAWSGGATPVVVLNKADAAVDLDGLRTAAASVAPGTDVVAISALTGDGVDALAAGHLRPGRTAVVLGSSGVGKSTLVNALLGHDHLRTAAVREDDSRGRHTTTHRELVLLPGGALLIDTPGIRSLGVSGAVEGMDPAFADIATLAAGCRFADCRHEREPGCAIMAAVADGRLSDDRLASHRKLEKEAAHVARSGDRLLREAERRRWKIISQASSRHMAEEYGTDR